MKSKMSLYRAIEFNSYANIYQNKLEQKIKNVTKEIEEDLSNGIYNMAAKRKLAFYEEELKELQKEIEWFSNDVKITGRDEELYY